MATPGDDGTRIAAAQAGDQAALEQLLREQYDRVYALALRLLGDRRDAEDATQDALIAIVRGLHRFDRCPGRGRRDLRPVPLGGGSLFEDLGMPCRCGDDLGRRLAAGVALERLDHLVGVGPLARLR